MGRVIEFPMNNYIIEWIENKQYEEFYADVEEQYCCSYDDDDDDYADCNFDSKGLDCDSRGNVRDSLFGSLRGVVRGILLRVLRWL